MKTVLIAEDDRILSLRIKKALEPYADRFSSRLVPDGQAAISVLNQEPVDLVVTDIQMPMMNGLILLAYIHTYHPQIPCIVTSSYATARMRAKVPREVLRFFDKPYKPADLARSIAAALEREEPPQLADGLRLIAFLNMIEIEKLTCGFQITTPGEPDATIYFDNGVIIDAQTHNSVGEAAFHLIMKREVATYAFIDMPPEPPSRRIFADLDELIRNVVVAEPETELPMI